ncbi:hypothetical protein F3Y22_tig00005939pilonHSYRG00173 [Hibiscus syriacus]|uniref:EF-hand domain-containing protein n=1 Tax=Hibiscus syriacus TaxID=106335 RepID=A0A6A3CDX0_HIBSY|nr:hypothetical protein F3Y22_tig00005939pilonHSYRG00173 [Hibiscus syriacus]
MFKMIDADNSGNITLEELKIGLEKVGSNLKDSEINGLMQTADIDNSGTIDYSEFIAAMLHLNKIQKEDHLFAAFNYFDKDGSGYITQDELQQVCEQFGLEDVHLEDVIREVDQDNIDHSVVESFGGGKTCITSRVYPTLAVLDNAHLHAFNNGDQTITINNLNAWSMNKPQMN